MPKAHPGKAPYACTNCNAKYTIPINLSKHLRNHPECAGIKRTAVIPEVKAVPLEVKVAPLALPAKDEVAPTARQVRIKWPRLEDMKTDLTKHTADWTVWSRQYEAQRGDRDPPLSRKSADEVDRVVKQLIKAFAPQPIPWQEWDDLDDMLESWDLEITTRTWGDYYHHLSWHARFLFCAGQAAAETVEGLQLCGREMQSRGRQDQLARLCLRLLKPDELIDMRNKIVASLNVKMAEYDKWIDWFLRERTAKASQLREFGLELRCFIDLMLRYNDVPLRVQNTESLYCKELDSTPNERGRQVCTLVLERGLYWRVIDMDKVGRTHMPLKLPLGKTASALIWFYLKYCRPPCSDGWVFVGARGGKWTTVSADLLRYLREKLGISSEEYCDRNFIHGSRTVGLAVYASCVNFNTDILRRFAILMRHSLETMERFYNTWGEWSQARKAIAEFINFTGQDDEYEFKPSLPAAELVKLRPFSSKVYDALLKERLNACIKTANDRSASYLDIKIPDASVGGIIVPEELPNAPSDNHDEDFDVVPEDQLDFTETAPVTKTEVQAPVTMQKEKRAGLIVRPTVDPMEHNALDPRPLCQHCGKAWEIVGPIGSNRGKKDGRYWCACYECGPGEDEYRWMSKDFRPIGKVHRRAKKRSSTLEGDSAPRKNKKAKTN